MFAAFVDTLSDGRRYGGVWPPFPWSREWGVPARGSAGNRWLGEVGSLEEILFNKGLLIKECSGCRETSRHSEFSRLLQSRDINTCILLSCLLPPDHLQCFLLAKSTWKSEARIPIDVVRTVQPQEAQNREQRGRVDLEEQTKDILGMRLSTKCWDHSRTVCH